MGPDFSGRCRKLRNEMKKKGIEAVLLTGNDDIRYYTGYCGLMEDRIFTILPREGKPKLIVTPLESEAKVKYSNTIFIDTVKDFMNELKGYSVLGYDEKQMNVLLFRELEKLRAKTEPFGKQIEIPRMIKEQYEIDQITKAIRLTRKAFESTVNGLAGKSEREIAQAIDIEFRRHGAFNAFESIVSSGPQGAFVHHKPNNRIIRKSDVVLVDVGCRVNGYCSDIARTFCEKPDSRKRKIYEDVKHIHGEIADTIRPGIKYMDVDNLQKKLFKARGYEVMHSFGHGVGLSVHDPVGNVLKENMVLTVEPGIYMKNIGGFRIEDMVVVKRGKARMLSKSIPFA